MVSRIVSRKQALKLESAADLEPEGGLEPPTCRLRVGCATTTPLGPGAGEALLPGRTRVYRTLLGPFQRITRPRHGAPGDLSGAHRGSPDGEAGHRDRGATQGGLDREEGRLEGELGGRADGQAAVGLLQGGGGTDRCRGVE